VQRHSHSVSCKKKQTQCRCNCPRPLLQGHWFQNPVILIILNIQRQP